EPDGPNSPNSVDARSDLFSLGIVWYEMLAGRRPFEGATFSHLAVAIMDYDPPPISQLAPGIPPEYDRIARKALTKDRSSRYQSAQELLADLKALRQQVASLADPIILQTGPSITADPTPVTTGQAEPLPTHTGAALRTNTGLERILRRDKR